MLVELGLDALQQLGDVDRFRPRLDVIVACRRKAISDAGEVLKLLTQRLQILAQPCG
jgi:hypothetical protein